MKTFKIASSDGGACVFSSFSPLVLPAPTGKNPNDSFYSTIFLESSLDLGVHNMLLSLPFPWEKPVRDLTLNDFLIAGFSLV